MQKHFVHFGLCELQSELQHLWITEELFYFYHLFVTNTFGHMDIQEI